ncbi:hypothetical protein [Wolbachia endosymbiont (group A) of Tiphia femorata]|uniref:hypothetical protein n=1 Tax=Wolbachia endosymbiont (group A) of Tiphia femorata TaxID=2954063 RepID=UPI002230E1A0|nr:hypothetical protein [Wolbachia endosymbiont (group A) of Tiphia femorata]
MPSLVIPVLLFCHPSAQTLGSSFFFSRFQTGMTPLLGSFSHVIQVAPFFVIRVADTGMALLHRYL